VQCVHEHPEGTFRVVVGDEIRAGHEQVVGLVQGPADELGTGDGVRPKPCSAADEDVSERG
jgi:hypothetical protein